MMAQFTIGLSVFVLLAIANCSGNSQEDNDVQCSLLQATVINENGTLDIESTLDAINELDLDSDVKCAITDGYRNCFDIIGDVANPKHAMVLSLCMNHFDEKYCGQGFGLYKGKCPPTDKANEIFTTCAKGNYIFTGRNHHKKDKKLMNAFRQLIRCTLKETDIIDEGTNTINVDQLLESTKRLVDADNETIAELTDGYRSCTDRYDSKTQKSLLFQCTDDHKKKTCGESAFGQKQKCRPTKYGKEVFMQCMEDNGLSMFEEVQEESAKDAKKRWTAVKKCAARELKTIDENGIGQRDGILDTIESAMILDDKTKGLMYQGFNECLDSFDDGTKTGTRKLMRCIRNKQRQICKSDEPGMGNGQEKNFCPATQRANMMYMKCAGEAKLFDQSTTEAEKTQKIMNFLSCANIGLDWVDEDGIAIQENVFASITKDMTPDETREAALRREYGECFFEGYDESKVHSTMALLCVHAATDSICKDKPKVEKKCDDSPKSIANALACSELSGFDFNDPQPKFEQIMDFLVCHWNASHILEGDFVLNEQATIDSIEKSVQVKDNTTIAELQKAYRNCFVGYDKNEDKTLAVWDCMDKQKKKICSENNMESMENSDNQEQSNEDGGQDEGDEDVEDGQGQSEEGDEENEEEGGQDDKDEDEEEGQDEDDEVEEQDESDEGDAEDRQGQSEEVEEEGGQDDEDEEERQDEDDEVEEQDESDEGDAEDGQGQSEEGKEIVQSDDNQRHDYPLPQA